MGASSEREMIESKMLELKYKRVQIQEEKEEYLEKLKKITGKDIKRKPVPDYIDYGNDRILSNAKSNSITAIKKNKTKAIGGNGKKNQLKKGQLNKKIKSASTYEIRLKKKNNGNNKKHIQETNQ